MAYNHNMPSRASKPQRPRDPNLLARSVMEDLIGEKIDGTPLVKPAGPPDTRNPAAVAIYLGTTCRKTSVRLDSPRLALFGVSGFQVRYVDGKYLALVGPPN